MSIDYNTEIKPEVMHNLDLDATDTDAEARYQILESANAAQRLVIEQAPIAKLDNIIQNATGKLLGSVAYYQWPSDFIRFVRLWVDYAYAITDSNLGRLCTLQKDGNFTINSLDKQVDSNNPKYAIIDGGFELRPMPNSDLVDGFLLEYIYNLPEISATQPSLLRVNLKNALIFKATELAALKGGNRIEHANKYAELYKEAI